MTRTKLWRCAAWGMIAFIGFSTLSPIEYRPTIEAPANLERLTAFSAIGLAFLLGYPRHRLSTLIMLVSIISLLEIAQNFVPGRHGRITDGLIKVAGAFLGFGLGILITQCWPGFRRSFNEPKI
jgi:hypothetical protein